MKFNESKLFRARIFHPENRVSCIPSYVACPYEWRDTIEEVRFDLLQQKYCNGFTYIQNLEGFVAIPSRVKSKDEELNSEK